VFVIKQKECTWTPETALERCASCISKLGALSRSSTMANTPGSIGFNPAWTMDNNVSSRKFIHTKIFPPLL